MAPLHIPRGLWHVVVPFETQGYDLSYAWVPRGSASIYRNDEMHERKISSFIDSFNIQENNIDVCSVSHGPYDRTTRRSKLTSITKLFYPQTNSSSRTMLLNAAARAIRKKITTTYFVCAVETNLDEELHALKPNVMTVNCTVAFMAQCISWNKCSVSCQSMGATSYRWFHDGCCECIGDTCINYGINESRCMNCPLKKDEDDDLKDQYDDYGQIEDDLVDDVV